MMNRFIKEKVKEKGCRMSKLKARLGLPLPEGVHRYAER